MDLVILIVGGFVVLLVVATIFDIRDFLRRDEEPEPSNVVIDLELQRMLRRRRVKLPALRS